MKVHTSSRRCASTAMFSSLVAAKILMPALWDDFGWRSRFETINSTRSRGWIQIDRRQARTIRDSNLDAEETWYCTERCPMCWKYSVPGPESFLRRDVTPIASPIWYVLHLLCACFCGFRCVDLRRKAFMNNEVFVYYFLRINNDYAFVAVGMGTPCSQVL